MPLIFPPTSTLLARLGHFSPSIWSYQIEVYKHTSQSSKPSTSSQAPIILLYNHIVKDCNKHFAPHTGLTSPGSHLTCSSPQGALAITSSCSWFRCFDPDAGIWHLLEISSNSSISSKICKKNPPELTEVTFKNFSQPCERSGTSYDFWRNGRSGFDIKIHMILFSFLTILELDYKLC